MANDTESSNHAQFEFQRRTLVMDSPLCDKSDMEVATEQHEADTSREPPHTWWSWFVISFQQLVIMWSIYILALGPIYWAWFDGKYNTGSAALAALYEPLWILAGIFPPLGRWLNWYIEFWI